MGVGEVHRVAKDIGLVLDEDNRTMPNILILYIFLQIKYPPQNRKYHISPDLLRRKGRAKQV